MSRSFEDNCFSTNHPASLVCPNTVLYKGSTGPGQGQTHENTKKNLRAPQNMENFLTR
jgi:hypothetical protein